MRIGIDGSCLANRRGFGRFARQTLEALARTPSAHEFVVFIDGPSAPHVSVPDRFETVVVDVGEAPTAAASAAGRRRLRDMLAMGRAVAGAGLDLVYFPATYSFFPVWNVKHVVVTMHDTLALAHPDLVFPSRAGRIAWALKEHAAGLWADRIVTVSESARRDLRDWFRWEADRIDVVTEGPDAVFRPAPSDAESDRVLAKYGIEPGTPYLLYVGGLSPHKNLPRLIEAFAAGAPESFRLVLVGDISDVFHTHIPVLRATVARLGLEGRVHFPGFVPDEPLVHLYSRAYALAQPSLMEGFGLPPVEAMACGTPILSSTAGSLPEVVGEAGVFFDPLDLDAMTRVLRDFCANPAARDRLAAVALERSNRFTWDAAAASLLKTFGSFEPKHPARIHRAHHATPIHAGTPAKIPDRAGASPA
ncbi:glycosyltransferase family 4 protein [Singulisphaera sp. PoT]|uniref:glycosyltransferase family 4 protein n=1 Tax=Singulisphaera sp. PoT TaxID=3411797 RepID=UPI003BF5EF5C